MKEIRLEAKKENIEKATEFVQEEMEEAGFSMKAIMQVAVAIDEIYVNIASYAYGQGTGMVTVQVDIEQEDDGPELELTFIDSGIPFNPVEFEDPDITRPAEERSIGGLGIFLVKKTMNGMKYRRKDGKNILTIKKKDTSVKR